MAAQYDLKPASVAVSGTVSAKHSARLSGQLDDCGDLKARPPRLTSSDVADALRLLVALMCEVLMAVAGQS